jgi:hypothetical protein
MADICERKGRKQNDNNTDTIKAADKGQKDEAVKKPCSGWYMIPKVVL